MPEKANAKSELDQNTKLLAGIGYLGILFIIPLILAGQDQYKNQADFLKYHANQGLVLLITEIALGILTSFLGTAFLFTFSALSFIGFMLWPAVWIIGIIFLILGFMNAMNGEKKPLPVIGGITIIK